MSPAWMTSSSTPQVSMGERLAKGGVLATRAVRPSVSLMTRIIHDSPILGRGVVQPPSNQRLDEKVIARSDRAISDVRNFLW